MNGSDGKAKKLSAAKRRLKEFQKKQTTDATYDRIDQISHTDSVEDRHSVGSGRRNGSVPYHVEPVITKMTDLSPAVSAGQPNLNNTATTDEIEQLQLQRNISPDNGPEVAAAPRVPDLSVSVTNYDQLLTQIDELKNYNVNLQKQILDEREAFGEQMQLQLGQLREQIQIHAQTIGILVGEKSQLQAALSQAKLSAESRQNDNQELNGRLSASRQRVGELEKQVASLSEQLQKAEKNSTELINSVEKLKAEYSSATSTLQDLKRRSDDLQERYLNKESECSDLVAKNSSLKNELSMLKVYVEQLSANASNSDVSESQLISSQNDQLRSEKAEMERLLKTANDTVNDLRVERDNIKRRHQTDLSGLEDHIAMLNGRIHALTNEIDGHLQKNSETETELAAANERLRASTSGESANEEVERAKDATITSLSSQLATAKRDLEELVANNVHFHQVVLDKDATIETLRGRIVELERASSDYRSVLATVEDVRTALSRALAQNAKLKSEYEELQTAFVRISNEKAELTDKLTTAQSQQNQQEQQQQQIPVEPPSAVTSEAAVDACFKVETQEIGTETDFVNMSSDENDNHALCRNTIAGLETRMAELRGKVKTLEDQISQQSLQLEEKQRHLVTSAAGSVSPTPSAVEKVEREVETDSIDLTAFATADRAAQLDTVQHALLKLEDRFGRVMREKADLLDQKERLEHLVIQLQSETDTIGEYITLYQKQRGTLKQQSEENAKFLQHLTAERMAMKTTMTELQSLVLKLVASHNQEPARIISTGPDFNSPDKADGSKRNSALKSLNGEEQEEDEEWPDLVEGEDNTSPILLEAPPIDPVSSRILQLLNSMTSSLVTFGGGNATDDELEVATNVGLLDARVLDQLTPNTRRLVNQRLHSLRHSGVHSPSDKQSPGECPCCRGQVMVI